MQLYTLNHCVQYSHTALLYIYTTVSLPLVQAEHNLRKLVKSSYWRYLSARLSFWSQCDTNFQNEDVDPLLAADFFEVRSH